jgi:hypothetical protein
MLDQPCLANPALCQKRDIAPIFNGSDKFFRFCLSIAKQIWPVVAIYYKWVFSFMAELYHFPAAPRNYKFHIL